MPAIWSFLFGTGLVILSILCFIGLIYLTPLAFGKKTYSSMSSVQQNLAKLAIVVQWITVAVALISALWASFGVEKNGTIGLYY